MVYILLGTGFEEAEALVPADILRRGGVDVALTGLDRRTVEGAHRITVVADLVAEDVALADGDMVVIPGGPGVSAVEGNEAAMALIRRAAGQNGLWLAAICAAPTLLARAGLIGNGNHAVCYPGMEGEMTAVGVAAHMDRSVVADGRLITGRAPGSAYDFGFALLETLRGRETAEQVRAAMYYGG